jgi:hypothetical protein
MMEKVTDPKFTIEESALDGWVRGGMTTRDLSDDPNFNKNHRPNW